MTAADTLRQCRATLSLIDRAECKDEAVWQKVVDTQAEVDRVLRDGEPSAPTDISRQLRAQAKQPFGPEGFALLVKAADEIERYYGGMMAWKATAEAKDCRPAPSLQAVAAAPEGVLKAAIAWWETCRPVGWSEASHIEHPTVNTQTDVGNALGKAVAAHLTSPQPPAAPSGEWTDDDRREQEYFDRHPHVEQAPSGDVERDKLTKALKAARAALKTADYVIKGREHTGFIDTTIAIIDDATKE